MKAILCTIVVVLVSAFVVAAHGCGDECSPSDDSFCDGDRVRTCAKNATCDQIWCEGKKREPVIRTVDGCRSGTTCVERRAASYCVSTAFAACADRKHAVCVTSSLANTCTTRQLHDSARQLVPDQDGFLLPADLDGDGRLDGLAHDGKSILLLSGVLDEATPKTTSLTGTSSVTPSLAFWANGDFDGDGAIDFVRGGRGGTLTIHFGGNPGSRSEGLINGRDYYVADVDGDGRMDLVTENTVQFSDGTREPSKWPTVKLDNSFGVPFVADADGDGKLDVIIVNEEPRKNDRSEYGELQVRTHHNDGDRRFSKRPRYEQGALPLPDGPLDPMRFAVGDVTGDRRADVVVFVNHEIYVLRAEGDGTFLRAGVLRVDDLIDRIVLVDLDGDGTKDIAAGGPTIGGLPGETSNAAAFYLNKRTLGTVMTTKARADGSLEPSRLVDPTHGPAFFAGAIAKTGGLFLLPGAPPSSGSIPAPGPATTTAPQITMGRCL